MSFLERMRALVAPGSLRALNNPSVSLNDPALYEALTGGARVAGVAVTPKTALTSSAVYACIRLLAESVGSLPLQVFERLEPRGRKEARTHPVWRLLHDTPNPEMTRITWVELVMSHLAGWGNCYWEQQLNNRGEVVALWPIPPHLVTVARVQGEKLFSVQVGNEFITLRSPNIVHVPLFGYDGLVGHSPITLNREAIGLAKATERFGVRFFENGARPGNVLSHPGKLSKEAAERLRVSWARVQGGLDNAHRTAILEEGMKLEQSIIPPEQAQFLETRTFQLHEVARIFRVPPHMIAMLDRATYSNIEQQSLEFVTYTLMPYLVRLEQAFEQSCFSARQTGQYTVKFNVTALVRGDIKSRFDAYAVGRNWGWLSANDVRELEDQNVIEGGDEYLVPLNMRGATDPAPAATPAAPADPAATRAAIRAGFTPIAVDAWRRVLRREAQLGEKLWPAGQAEHALRTLAPVIDGITTASHAAGFATPPKAVRSLVVQQYLGTRNAANPDAEAEAEWRADALIEQLLDPTAALRQETA